MASITLRWCCILVLVLVISFAQGQSSPKQRISQIKCREYREKTITRSFFGSMMVGSRSMIVERFNCPRTVDLIVGGEAAKPGEFPHQALIGYSNAETPGGYKFFGGGTLISDRFVLTAAHCAADNLQRPEIVRLGEHSLQTPSDNEQDFGIDKFIRHPQHRFGRAYHDIALVKLNQIVQFSKMILPACLWTGSKFNFSSVVATGFGANGTEGFDPDVLQKVELDLLDVSVCNNLYRSLRELRRGLLDGQLCIGNNADDAKDTCQGDSGGPVQVKTETEGCIYHVVGITSTSMRGCGIGKTPGVYTRVSSYIDWIEETVWG